MKNILFVMLIIISIVITNKGFTQYNHEEIISEDFTITSKDRIELAGVIEYPSAKDNLPAVILVWGNGPHTRDQEISGTPMFKQISDRLTNAGVMVMRMDKRGFGESSVKYKSSESNYTTLDLMDDIEIAIELLKKHEKADPSRVGIIGHSEGAMIASILASKEKVNWIILVAPPAVSGKEIALEQSKYNRKKLGIDDSTSINIGKVFEQYFDFISKDYSDDSIYYSLGKKFLLAHGLEENDERISPEFIDQLLDGFRNKWHQCFYALDMRDYQTKISIPTLAIFGDHDYQVTIEQNLLELNNSLTKAGNKHYEIKILSDSDHFFLTYNGDRLEKHKFGEMKVSEKLLDSIVYFIEGTRKK